MSFVYNIDKRIRMLRVRKSSIIYIFIVLCSLIVLLHSYNSRFYSSSSIKPMEYEDILTILKRDHIVTDIKVKKCSKYTSCKLSKVEQVQEWKKIDTPLELYANSFQFQNFVKSISIFQHYIYVVELPIDKMERGLVDVRITSSETPPPSDEGEGEWVYEQVGSSLNLWKKFQFKEEGASIVNTEFIRSIEVLYGMDDLTDGRDNWNMQEEPIPIMDYENIIPPHLSLLKVSMKRQPEIIAEHERFQSAKNQQLILAEGRFFKMLQLSDLHFGPGKGNCHGNVEVCEADAKTLEFIESSINKEEARPVKLVIITGDLIDSFQTKDFRSTILKGLSIILQKKIPFIFTFGELDEIAAVLESEELKLERDGKKPQDKDRNIDPVLKLNILNFISTLPRCYNTAQKYDKNIHGLTNYNLRVFHLKDTNNEKDLQLDKPEVVISVLDSENHKIQASQINHLNRFNKGIKTQDPFKLLFFHYPLPNYRPSGGFNIIGSYNQKSPLNTKTDIRFRDDIFHLGYQVVSVGHEHENDACIVSENKSDGKVIDSLWLCYNSVTGESGETISTDYARKLRIFQIDFEDRQMLSWKREQKTGEAFDYQMVHDYGKKI